MGPSLSVRLKKKNEQGGAECGVCDIKGRMACTTNQCCRSAHLDVVVLHLDDLLQEVDTPPSARFAVVNNGIVQKFVELVAGNGRGRRFTLQTDHRTAHPIYHDQLLSTHLLLVVRHVFGLDADQTGEWTAFGNAVRHANLFQKERGSHDAFADGWNYDKVADRSGPSHQGGGRGARVDHNGWGNKHSAVHRRAGGHLGGHHATQRHANNKALHTRVTLATLLKVLREKSGEIVGPKIRFNGDRHR